MSRLRASSRALLGVAAALALASALSAQPLAVAGPSLTLDAALALAEARSPQITAAEAGVRAAEARARQAGFMPNPELALDVENALGSGPFSGFNAAETTLSVGQRFELGGKRNARRTAAQAEVEVARLRLGVVRADLRRTVRDRFAEAIAAQERVLLAETAVERARELARIAQELVDAGRDPPLRALRARTTLAEAEANLLDARSTAASTARAVGFLVDQDAPSVAALADPSPAAAAIFDPTTTFAVRLAEAELAAAEAVVARERTVGRSDVTVAGGVRRFEQTGDAALVFGVSAPIPVRDANRGAVAAATAEVQGAQARRAQALSEAALTARNAQASLSSAEARVGLLETASIPEATEAVQLARLGYQAGRFTLLDVLDAERALADAQSNLINARLERARARAALDRAADR